MSTALKDRFQPIDDRLSEGGEVVAANDRAARSVASAFAAARRAEGLTAWRTPSIHSWETWVRTNWLARNSAGLVLLNPLQEQALWTRVIQHSSTGAALSHPERLAKQAQRAYRLLCSHSPSALKPSARDWIGDAAVFSEWLSDFDALCRRDDLTSASRLPLLLTESLAQEVQTGEPDRPPLLLVGFDRLLATQSALLDSWGQWQLDLPAAPAADARYCSAQDERQELAACVRWLRQQLAANPQARLMVVTTALDERRGAIERALMQPEPGGPEPDFEFSLGVPLAKVSLVRSALLLLRWLHKPLSEAELDWLTSAGHTARSAAESIALAETMRELRHKGMERTEWSLQAFLGPEPLLNTDDSSDMPEPGRRSNPRPPAEWIARLASARKQLLQTQRMLSPLDWAAEAAELLTVIGWPGYMPLASSAYQAQQSWEKALESCGSLGFTGEKMDWAQFVSAATSAASDAIFTTESSDPPVLITQPLESAGQVADAIWFLGANESSWPGRGAPHPLLPIQLQRNSAMPHASALADWELADSATRRLMASAAEVVFSYARIVADGESRPSRLIAQQVGQAVELEMDPEPERNRQTEDFKDDSQIPFPLPMIEGGSAALTRQSLCPFQAFATARLKAQHWEPAEAGLTARQRGQLLHDVLHQVWSGKHRGGIRTLEELRGLSDLEGFVRKSVDWVLEEKVSRALRETVPARFLGLEADRLTRLVIAWLEYERERSPFSVTATEVQSEVVVAGLTLKLRLDRVDLVEDGTALVIDYKTGTVSTSAWVGDRPDDVQLPLYAVFSALGEQKEQRDDAVQGLAFACVRPGKAMKFHGRVRVAAKLRGDFGKMSAMVKNPLTDRQLEEWRAIIERLGDEFLHGNAEVSPKNGLKTCERCHLHAVCRIYENQSISDSDSDDDERDEEGEDA